MKDAAEILNMTEAGIRKRIERGKIEHRKDEQGRTVVYITEEDLPVLDAGQLDLVDELRSRVRYLERTLEDERRTRTEERQRHDTLMAQLMQRIPQIEGPREGEAPAGREATEEPQERSGPAAQFHENVEGTHSKRHYGRPGQDK